MKLKLKNEEEKANWKSAYKLCQNSGESAKASKRFANSMVRGLRKARKRKFKL